MKPIKPILIGLVLVLAACMPIQTERPADVITGLVATATILETSTTGTMAPPAEDQPHEPDERVEFEPGITSTKRSGSLAEGGSKEYVLSGAAGQAMYIETVGYNAPVTFTLTSPAGETWSGKPHASEVYIFRAQVVLSRDGDYVVTVAVPPNAGTTRYDVVLTIDPSYAPERVELETGATSITRSGTLLESEIKEYVLSAAAGQSMHIQTVGYDAPVHFTLRSPVDESWSGEPQASDVYIFAAQVSLPKDGDYVVRLSVPSGATRYDVTFTMVGGWLPVKQPERVEFAPGTSSIEYSSILPSGLSIKQYVLAAKEGQIMTVNFVSEDVPVSLSITSPSGLQLFTEGNQTSPTDGGYRAGYSFTLAETGDYLVMLIKAEHTPSTNYTVEITIQ